MKIYYYSFPYTDSSNGLRLAYEFVVYLRNAGFDAFNVVEDEHVNEEDYPPEYKENVLSSSCLNIGDDDIVIYPETVFGNPLKATNIIRAFLNRVEKDIAFGEDEYYVTYNSAIYPGLPVFYCQKDEVPLFSSLRNEKKTDGIMTIYFGKARYNVLDKNSKMISTLQKKYKRVEIITRKYPSSHIETLKLVRDSDLLVSFDALTNMNYESTLLGTPVLVVDDYFKLENEIEINHYGFAYDVSEIERAKKSVGKAYDEYVSIINNQGKDFPDIINKAERHFERIKIDTEYRKLYVSEMKEILRRYSPCAFDNINDLSDIPSRIRKKMAINDGGVNIKVEIKYVLLKLKLLYFVKDIHKVLIKLFSRR